MTVEISLSFQSFSTLSLEEVKVAQSCLTLCNPSWNSPDQNTGVGSLSLLQGIFSTQGSNPDFPHCRRILYQISHKGSPVTWYLEPKPSLLGQGEWQSRAFSIFSSISDLYSQDTSSPFPLPSCDNQNISSYHLMSPKGQITLAPSWEPLL